MSKICPNCQAALGDNDKFCAACGAKIESDADTNVESETSVQAEPVAEPAAEEASAPANAAPSESAEDVTVRQPVDSQESASPSQSVMQQAVPYKASTEPNMPGETVKKSSGKGLLITLIIIIAALCIAAGLLLYFLVFSGGGYKSAVDAYVEYIESYDEEDLVKAIGNDALIYYVEEKCGSDMKTFYRGCELMENMNDVMDVDVDYKITDTQKMSSDELEDYEEGGYKVSEGYIVDVETTVYSDGLLSSHDGQGDTETLTVIKFGSDWCVVEAAEMVESIIQAGEGANALSDIDWGDLDF